MRQAAEVAEAAAADMTTASSPTTVAKVTVNLPMKVWAELSRVAEECQTTKTEALRQAIATHLLLRKVRQEGAEILIRRGDGTVERVLFAY